MGEEFSERPTRSLRDTSKVDAPLIRVFNMLRELFELDNLTLF